MTFLKKLGEVVLKVTGIVTGFGPGLAAIIPGTKDDVIIQKVSIDLAEIAQIIQQAEVFGQALGLPGAQKLQAAAPAVAQIILQSSILAKHELANPVLFQQGCTKVADGMADVLNSLKDNVETISKT
jgi:hypothetical protein